MLEELQGWGQPLPTRQFEPKLSCAMSRSNDDFYKALRQKIQTFLKDKGEGYKYADYLLLAPDLFHLMCRLTFDSRVSIKSKAALAGGIAYFISPFDLIPEAIVGPVGYVDDIAVAALILNKVINDSGGDIAREHWAGDRDLIGAVQEILKVADEMVGSGLWTKIRTKF